VHIHAGSEAEHSKAEQNAFDCEFEQPFRAPSGSGAVNGHVVKPLIDRKMFEAFCNQITMFSLHFERQAAPAQDKVGFSST